jgi:arabinofuranosyltransferase
MNYLSTHNLKIWLQYILLLICIVICLYNCLQLKFTVDDAYISMRYARHLYEGKGLVYNIGEYVEGYSNFLWVIILAFGGSLGFNLPFIANVLGILFSLLTLVVVFKLMERINDGVSLWSILPVIFLSTNWDFTGWATGGLETALFTLLLFVTIYRFYEEVIARTSSYQLSAIICGLLCLTRPEGYLFSGLYFLTFGFVEVKKRNDWLKRVTAWLAIVAIIVVPHIIWKIIYYGDILPNSFYIKVNKPAYFERGIRYAGFYLIQSHAYLWILPIIIGIKKRLFCIYFMFIYSLIYVLYILWVGGDWMALRFFAPIIPVLIFMMVVGFKSISDYALSKSNPIIRYSLIFVLILYGGVTFWFNALPTYKYGKNRKFVFNEKLQILDYGALHLPEGNAIEVARAFKKVLLPNEVVAASFAGFTGFYTDIRVIDTLGLNDKYIARLPIAKPGQPGHEKQAPFEYLKNNKVVCLYPWPVKNSGDNNSQYSVEYEPNKYLTFGSTLPYNEVIKKFQDRGFNVFYRGDFVPNPKNITLIENDNNFNFETGNYLHWTVEGMAFGTTPQFRGKWENSSKITGYKGNFLVNSYYNNSDAANGKLVSDKFIINGDTITFLISGGNNKRTSINLVVAGTIVRTATGDRSEELIRKSWNVADYMGKEARIEIIDSASGDWGHIVIDDIQVGQTNNGKTSHQP